MGVIKQYVAGLIAAFGAFCLGASIGWSGPMEMPVKSGQAYKFVPDEDEWGWISSLLTLGGCFMCIPTGIMIAVIGRKVTMLVLVLPYMIGWAAIVYPFHIASLYIGRFILGACGGAFCITAPMYTTEIAETRIRGIMGCFFQLLIVHGILYGFIVGAFLKPLLVNILCAILPIIFFIMFFWMPESPIYLLQKGKTEKAEKAVRWLRGKDADISDELVAMTAEANKEKAQWRKAFGSKATLKGLFMSISLMFFQQFTGVNAILFYATNIFINAGPSLKPEICTIIIGVVQVFATMGAILLIERLGRRLLLFISAVMMCIATIFMGCYFNWLLSENVGYLPVIAICIFIIGFSLGFGPVPWVVMAEFFAEDVKPICGSISGTTNWFFAFLVTKLFPVCIIEFGPAVTFWIFGGVALGACIFVMLLVPETKGKTLNEIQEKLA